MFTPLVTLPRLLLALFAANACTSLAADRAALAEAQDAIDLAWEAAHVTGGACRKALSALPSWSDLLTPAAKPGELTRARGALEALCHQAQRACPPRSARVVVRSLTRALQVLEAEAGPGGAPRRQVRDSERQPPPSGQGERSGEEGRRTRRGRGIGGELTDRHAPVAA